MYSLSDFSFSKNPSKYFHRLNGTKHFIRGNHDKNSEDLPWNSIQDYKELYVNDKFVILFHYGCRVWNKSHHKSIMLYGHSHNNLPGNNQSLDVGVDCWDYKPVNMFRILERLKTLPSYIQKDHHEVRQKST